MRESSVASLANRASWQRVHAVLLTHTHTDHWRDTTFVLLRRRRIPLYCHAGHHQTLRSYSPAFVALLESDLVRFYEEADVLSFSGGLCCRPIRLCHDSGATFGFRIDGSQDLFGHTCSFAYAADLGCWDEQIVSCLCDVDLLAVEFNHDVSLERNSNRPAHLVLENEES